MINLLDLVNKYIDEGYNEIYANAKVAQDIILRYLFKSNYKNNVTLKGGVVMYNLSKNKRRATIDIDIDLIKLFLNDDNLYKIFTSSKLNGIDLNVDVNKITELKHQDYRGKRLPILIKDNYGNAIDVKVDVGVHTDYNIIQDELCFTTFIDNETMTLLANSKEQIFVEKIIPMVKFGNLSTRYKDFFDLYWLIENGNLNTEKIKAIFNDKIFDCDINGVTDMGKLVMLIKNVLSDNNYLMKVNERKNNWLDIPSNELSNKIVSFFENLM